MAALYPRLYLMKISADDMVEPAKRYLYKYENQRKEIARLKPHEKDFLFRVMRLLYKEKNTKAYDLYNISEAKEFLFEWIILTHSNQIMVFDGPIPGPEGYLTPKEKYRDKRFFYEYISIWKNRVDSGKGPFLSIIKTEVNKKIKSWKELQPELGISDDMLRKKIEYVYATFFHIFYYVQLYFAAELKPYVIREMGGYDFVFTPYSYIHIVSRHYYPNMNQDIGVSLNQRMDCINFDDLPNSCLSLIEQHINSINSLTQSTEYFLYEIMGEKYIMWIKYKVLNETKKEGFEVRSFYKCQQPHDLALFSNNDYLIIS